MSDALRDRLPPNDKFAESSLLGGLFRTPEMFPTVQGIVTAESFYQSHHGVIFKAMADLWAEKKPVDLVSVHDLVVQRNQLEEIGGVKCLAELFELVATGANAEYHASIVRETYAARSLIYSLNVCLRDAYDRAMPTIDIVTMAQSQLATVGMMATGAKDNIRRIDDITAEVLREIDQRVSSGEEMSGLPTGYPAIDASLNGLKPGELIIVGARPSVGKTAWGVNVMANIATAVAEAGQSSLLFSIEMPAVQIGARLLSIGSGVPMHRFTRGHSLAPDDAAKLNSAASMGIGAVGIYVDDSATITAAQMLQVLRKSIRKHKTVVAIVDYLQLVQPENPRENRVQQVGMISRRLKAMARELEVPIVCLCQLNREVENRPDQKPRISDLRESGEIEQHADVVVLLHRPPGQDENADVWSIEAILAKVRNGPTGTVPMNYRRKVMRFESAA